MRSRNKTKLVHGIGINDAEYAVTNHAMVDGRMKMTWMCPFYVAWRGMLKRCYCEKERARRPTYAGCTVVVEWHSFMAFRAWMMTQDHDGKQLDKDILIPGNRIYGPDACVFVPRKLNGFIVDQCGARGEWPPGVCWNRDCGKFQAQCRDPFSGKHENLGLFTCPSAAHEAYRHQKNRHAMAYADQQTDPRIAQALRTRYASQEEV